MLWLVVSAIVGAALWWWLRPSPSGPSLTPLSPPPRQAQVANELLVLFGSQTGTAHGFASSLAKRAQRLGFNGVHVVDSADMQLDMLRDYKAVVYCVATYGEGEPTDPMTSFYEALTGDNDPSLFTNLHFAVFGLGDKQYKYFCKVADVVQDRMVAFGASMLCPTGRGDAGGRLEEEFDVWCESLWPALSSALAVQLKSESDEPELPEFKLRFWGEAPAVHPFPEAPPMLEPTPKQPVFATVLENTELLQVSDGRSTRRIALGFEGFSIAYQAGDHAGVLPCNSDEVVSEYMCLLDVDDVTQLGKPLSLADANGRNQLPARVTAATALKWYIDLCGYPKKSSLRVFAHYCADGAERAEMLDLLRVNPSAEERFRTLTSEVKTVAGVLKRFPSCKVPLGHFLETMPRLNPRYFSIASDQLVSANSVGITVAVVAGGVCTSMLSQSRVGDKVPFFVRKSTFHLPLRQKKKPLLMIGPGTGVAPLVGFCHRRSAWMKKGHELGAAHLFFGCRTPDDCIHQDFLKACQKSGVLSELNIAYSRTGPKKVYVQHHLQEQAARVWELLQAGANVYVCGDAKYMARDVDETLVRIVESQGNLTAVAAKEFMTSLASDGRLHKDVWSA